MVASSSEAYTRYSKAQTMDRIDIKAVPVDEPEAQMLANRVKVNILRAIPSKMKDDFNGARVESVEEILFKMMVQYQPGGQDDI